MKRIWLLLLAILPLLLAGQSFDAGFRAGVSASQISGDYIQGYNKPGIYAGIFTSLDVSPRSLILLEMSYVEKGARQIARPDKGVFRAYKLMLNYIEMPVSYEYFINDQLAAEGGLSFGVLLNRSNNEEDEGGVISQTKPFRNYELAFNAGALYYFTDNMAAGIRHSVSIIPVRLYEDTDSQNYNTPWGPSRHQRIYMLRFYVSYRI